MFLSRSETGQEMFCTDIVIQRGVGESMLIIPISIPSRQNKIKSLTSIKTFKYFYKIRIFYDMEPLGLLKSYLFGIIILIIIIILRVDLKGNPT